MQWVLNTCLMEKGVVRSLWAWDRVRAGRGHRGAGLTAWVAVLGPKMGQGWGGSPALRDGSHKLPLQKRGVQSPPCMQGPCGVPRARAICPETEEGFVLTPRASPLLTVPSPPAHRVPDTEICTEKAAYPSGS